jgi:alcohol dehydrogenase class IV
MWPPARDFTIDEGDRVIRFGPGALADAPRLLAQEGFAGYALLTTDRAAEQAPEVVDRAAVVVTVPHGQVPDAAAAVRGAVGARPLVALGGGRVVDATKAIGSADGLSVATIATTLSGAEMSAHHRPLPGHDRGPRVRPALVIADPAVMASQPLPRLAESAMNALAHALEALYAPRANPISEATATLAARQLDAGFAEDEPDRPALALGALMAGHALGLTGFALHHVLSQTIVRTTGAPHGATNAVMLPHVAAFMQARAPRELALFNEAVDVGRLSRAAGATGLAALGVDRDALPAIVKATIARRADLAATPGDPLTPDDLRALLDAAY